MDGSNVTVQDVIIAAIAIPVMSLLAVKLASRLMRLAGRIWRWVLKQGATQAAEAVDSLMTPRLDALEAGIMSSMDEIRQDNARDHSEVQRRLGGVEVRLSDVEARLAAVEARLVKEDAER